ncbi:MAG: DUF1080 domain-containing protein [Opitutus sp.]|nr:DUF1080 domain-containing protein [Opitutus sp.]
MFLPRWMILVVFVTATLAAKGATPPPVEALTETQLAQFKVLDREFDRLESFLAAQPDNQPKLETKRVLEVMKKRAAGLRTSFDQTRFDEIRYEVNFEHQQMLLWLLPPRLQPIGSPKAAGPRNELSALEKTSGWELLFDGKSLAGWHGYGLKGPPSAGWEVRDGALYAAGGVQKRVELVTDRKLENFELSWEWRAAPGADSGLKYFVTENSVSRAAHEFQFGDALLAEGKPVKASGDWNQSRLVVEGQVVEQWLNGKIVRSYQISPKEKAKATGQLLLTCRGAEAAVRDLKVRELK